MISAAALASLAALGHLLQFFQPLFHALYIGEEQLSLDGVDIAQRVYGAVHMGDVVILKTADHLDDGGAFADIGQELIAQSFALAGAAHETGNINEIHAGMDGLFGLCLGGQGVHARVRHSHRSLVGLDGAEGIVGGLGILSLGQGIEEGGLAHVGQPDDTDAESHAFSLWGECRGMRSSAKQKAPDAPGHFIVNMEPDGKVYCSRV